MRRLWCAALATALALTFGTGACGSDDAQSPGTAMDGGPTQTSDGANDPIDSGDGSTPGTDAPPGEQCHDLVQEGAFVAPVKKPLPSPAATGGTIAPGKYVLTASSVYTDSDAGGVGPGLASTLFVTGDTFDGISTVEGGSSVRVRSTFTTSGNQLTATSVCYYPPLDGSAPGTTATEGFSATPTTLTTYLDFGALGGVFEYVYTKQ